MWFCCHYLIESNSDQVYDLCNSCGKHFLDNPTCQKKRISPGLKSFKALFYQIDMRMTHHVQFEQCVPVAVERASLFFANPGNLRRIMPPETGTELVRLKLVPPPGIAAETATIADRDPLAGAGSEIVTSFRILPFFLSVRSFARSGSR